MKPIVRRDRRRFLKSVAASGGAAAASGFAFAARDEPAIDLEALVGAERVAGVEFTESERQQMLESVRQQRRSCETLRGRHPDEVDGGADGGPAEVFDPRLPGMTFERDVRPPRFPAHRPRPIPDDESEIAFARVPDLAHWVQSGQITSVRLTNLYLERLKRANETLECVITFTEDLALEQARRADAEIAAGRVRGPLHGLPWGAKDLFDTNGIPTTWGAAPYKDRVPNRDATVVRKLETAGAVLIAKLALGALAYGDRWFGGRTNNPFDPSQGSSGSSAGSAAATAAGLVAFSLGTETYGSIMSPSIRCGTTGYRPTFGRVSRHGAMTLCWSLDKVGPICRSAEDCAYVLEAIAGPDPLDPATVGVPLNLDLRAPLEGLRVGTVGFDAREPSPNDQAVLDALVADGATLVPVQPPGGDLGSLIFLHIAVEAAAAFDELTRSNRDDEMVWQDDAAWPNTFRATRLFPAVEYFQARRRRRTLMVRTAELFDDVDVLVASGQNSLTALTNMTGHPAVTIRKGFRDDGTPRATTFWGRLFDDSTLLRVAHAAESRLGLLDRRPAI